MKDQKYLTGPMVQRRYGISDTTLWRWVRDAKLAFPQPVLINRRRYFRVDEIDAWDEARKS